MTDLEEVVATLLAKAEEHESAARRLRDAAALVRGGEPTPPPSQPGATPKRRPANTSDLVLEIVNSEPTQPWSVLDLHDEMFNRGWNTASTSPIDALRASVDRLAKLGQIERFGKGVYIKSGHAAPGVPSEMWADEGSANGRAPEPGEVSTP